MTVVTGSSTSAENARTRRHALAAELREVEYWRRLVAARLDLAVAAVTALEEPANRELPCAPTLPGDLRRLIGLGDTDALGEAAALERLRDVLHDLGAYAAALRSSVHAAEQAPRRAARHPQ
ncbi:MAG: hypothetical protein WAL50_04930 [Kineosporiaceae bacterium]|jgi:hypothetical protein